MQILGPGKHVLQIDASDEYRAAAPFEETDGKKNICEYKSGAFKTLELHYHSMFKEILAVKNGIEKFQFHLLGHNFIVEMDMSSFSKMLQFKRKMLPHPQLLRWSNWFSQWSFQVGHIKRKDKLITDNLSIMFFFFFSFSLCGLSCVVSHHCLYLYANLVEVGFMGFSSHLP